MYFVVFYMCENRDLSNFLKSEKYYTITRGLLLTPRYYLSTYTFSVVVRSSLGDRNCTIYCNYCLPAATGYQPFCLYFFLLVSDCAVPLQCLWHESVTLISTCLIIIQAWAQPKKKFQDKNFHKFQDTWQVVGRSHAQTRVDNGYMYGPRISKL